MKTILSQINNVENILSIVVVVGVIALVLLFFFTVFFLTKTTSFSLQEKTLQRLDSSKSEHFNSNAIERRIKAYGGAFLFKGKLTPLTYVFIKFGFALAFLMIGTLFLNVLIGVVLAILGFFLLDILLKVSNSIDNQKMMNDLKLFCAVLNIQTLSGTSIASALAEGYSIVKHPRLKNALVELSSKIFAHQNFNESVDEFNEMFSNKYIDSCCTILKQSQDSGKSSKLLKSLSNQIVDIQTALHIKEVAAEETKNALLNLAIFGGFMMIVMFAWLSQMDLTSIF